MKFPKAIFFISAGVFCEKIAYFGIRTVLPLYFIDVLQYTKKTAITIFHSHGMLVYISSLIGAIIADCWLGKFHTVLYFTFVYVFGVLLLTSSSVPTFNLPIDIFTILGLILTAVPAGMMKPCTAAFGGDQFKLPEQESSLKNYFSMYYYVLTIAFLAVNFVTPIFRKDVACFGSNTCYPLAFAVPTVTVIAFAVIFMSGKPCYIIRKPEGNIIIKVVKCICHAVRRKKSSPGKREHWLDYADDEYDVGLIEDVKSVLKLLKLFLATPLYWALFEQLGSFWIFQGTRMDGEVFGYLIKPDQLLLFNSIGFIILMPIFQFCIYPVIGKLLHINSPLRKMTVGLFLAALGFIVSGIVELKLEKTYRTKMADGLAQFRIFNTLNCNVTINLNDSRYHLEALDVYTNLSIPADEKVKLNFKARFDNCPFTDSSNFIVETFLDAKEGKATSWFLTKNGISLEYEDSVEKSKSGDPSLRALIFSDINASSHVLLNLESNKNNYIINMSKVTNFTDFIQVNHNRYNLSINNVTVVKYLPIKFGGVYTIVGYLSNNHQFFKLVTLTEPNSIHMLWLLPQYVLMTMADIMFSVVNLEFAYSQAPENMKSLLQATYFLGICFGNLIVVIITKMHMFDRQTHEVFFYAVLMLVDVIIFAVMSRSYEIAHANKSSDDENIRLQHGKLLNDMQKG